MTKVFDLSDDAVYYGQEANELYMSVSQYKNYCQCEAKAQAELEGQWEDPVDQKALLVGNYVHSYFESEASHQEFKEKNREYLFQSPTIAVIKDTLDRLGIDYKKSGKKDELLALLKPEERPMGEIYADFVQAEDLIKALERQHLFQYLWQGEKEVPVTGELYGAQWKGKIDLLNIDKGYFVDLKTTADLSKRFFNKNEWRYQSFAEEYGYVTQVAVYEQLLEQVYEKPFTGYIFAVSKQKVPDVVAIELTQDEKQQALADLEDRLPRVLQVKSGEDDPVMCGHCDFCRTYKQLDRFITLEELMSI